MWTRGMSNLVNNYEQLSVLQVDNPQNNLVVQHLGQIEWL